MNITCSNGNNINIYLQLSNSTNVEKNRIDTPAPSASTDFPNSKTNRESSLSLPSCKKTEDFESEFCLGNVYKCITTDTKHVRAIEVSFS